MSSKPSLSANDAQRGRYIPWLIVLFFVAQAILFAWFTMLATETHPGQVTTAPYQKGLRYNETLAAASKANALGWQGTLEAHGAPEADIRLTLTNAAGAPIDGASVRLYLTRPTVDGMDQNLPMAPQGSGRYHARATLPAIGVWELRASVAVGEDQQQFTKRVTLP